MLTQDCMQLDADGKPWIQTYTNRPFPIGDPQMGDFNLTDIGSHLSRLNRYTGAIQLEQYSVAEHSVRVAFYLCALVGRQFQSRDRTTLIEAFRLGLMHDAHEAYLNDLNSPLKKYLLSVGADGYAKLAARYDRTLAVKYGLTTTIRYQGVDLLREADLSVLDLERPNVMGPPPRPWNDLGTLPKVHAKWPEAFATWGWAPNVARRRFMKCAAECGLVDT